MRHAWVALVAALGLICASGADVFAQDHESHWGISASLVPRWSFPDVLADAWDIDTDMRGSEVRIGVVRGSDAGGDAGVSFVRKFVADGSFVNLRESACVQMPGASTQCARGAYHVAHDAGFTGVEGHVFMPFASIGRRVQIGGLFAGGIARVDGTADRFLEHLVISGASVTTVTETLGFGPFKESLRDFPSEWPVIPIGRAELAVAVLVRPGLKVRGTGGVNFPGYNRFGVSLQYLFGAR